MTQSPFIERRSMLRLSRDPLLNQLDIELTERCNNACQHCYINRPADDFAAKSHELTTDQWKDVLRQAAELGALSVHITGGEPLLREDFPELYLFARRLGMKVTLLTNGRCITPEIADLFARTPALEKIEITVYGMRAKTYDSVACASGAFVAFRKGIQNLMDRGVPFKLKGALLPQNKSDIQTLDAWASTIPWMPEPPVYSMVYNLRARRDSAARNQRINQLRVPPAEAVAHLDQRFPNYRRETEQFCTRFIGPQGDNLFSCGAGKQGCVDAFGQYQPCMLLRDPSLSYDLSTGSLRDALTNFFPQLSDIKATNPDYLKRCGRCFLHGLCEQCPAKSWMEHGQLDTPVDYLCDIAHEQARYLGLLRSGEKAWEVTDWQQRIALMENGTKL